MTFFRTGALRLLLLLASFTLLFPHSAQAQPAPPDAPGRPLNSQNLAAFLDAFSQEQMQTHNLAGVLVAAVLEDQMIFSRGYGYANIAANQVMDPATTVFRGASLSKLFTATALMQLAETGRVDLHTDINQYLGGVVPNTFPQPITIAHLLTHTAGFDELNAGVRFPDPAMLTGLGEDVLGSMPARVRPPGEILTYSNYGYSLAGYIVEVVSGMAFEEYLQEFVFQPLQMQRSTFSEPPPKLVQDQLAVLYAYRENQHVPRAPLYHNQRPAGALYTNIEDLAHFIIAQLNHGVYQDNRLLAAPTIAQMQQTQFSHHPALEGWTYGFSELSNSGLRIIGHPGDLNGAYTLLFLIPEIRFGAVFHYNSPISAPLEEDPRIRLYEEFLAEFYPQHQRNRPMNAAPSAAAQPVDLSGTYRFTRYAHQTPGKLLMPMALAQVEVTQDQRGKVRMHMPLGMIEESEWLPYSADLFRQPEKETYLGYKVGQQGRADYLFFTSGGAQILERVPWYELYWVILLALLIPLLLFILGLLAWPLMAAIRRYRPGRPGPVSSGGRLARRLRRGIAVSGLLLGILIGLMISHVMATLSSPLLFLLPWISLAGWSLAAASIVLLVLTVGQIRKNQVTRWSSLLNILTAAAGLSFTWVLYFGNLLRFTSM